jgi:AraC-like DNA-binding protein
MSDTATTIATWAFALDRALRQHYRVDPAPLFAASGIDRSRLSDAGLRIPVQQMTRLWRSAAALTGDACLGLRVAEHVSPTTFHALGFVAMSSQNLMEAVTSIIRHANAVSDIAAPRLDMRGEHAWLHFDTRPGSPEIADEAIDAFLGAIFYMSRTYVSLEPPVVAVHLRRCEPAVAHDFQTFFRVPVHFSSQTNAFVSHLASAIAQLPTWNPALNAANEKVLAEYRQQQGVLSLREQVVRWMSRQFPGEPRQEALAETLHMSVRKLQRLLVAENTGFQPLLDEVRFGMAQTWLRQDNKSVQQISDDLGFANPSAFTRAFRRWSGESPDGWRKRERHANTQEK